MSYPRELDDYADHELVAEIVRRNRYRKENKCDYCGEPSTCCLKRDRHNLRKVITLE